MVAAGFEAGVRTGQGAPAHHDGGWHLTGTLGTIAAGAGSARLLGLDAQRLTYAIGIATTQAAGMQQNRGTMCKSLHAGKAAASGALAALLAAKGFNSSDEILEGKRGFTRIYSSVAAPELIVDGLGERWEITRNGYKPYACGIVLHPLIDAMIDFSAPMTIGNDEWLTVAARDNERRDSLAPQDPYEEVVTVLLRIKGADLKEYRSGRIDKVEARKRVRVGEF